MSVSFNINVSDVTVCKCISFANVIVCVYVCVRPCMCVLVCLHACMYVFDFKELAFLCLALAGTGSSQISNRKVSTIFDTKAKDKHHGSVMGGKTLNTSSVEGGTGSQVNIVQSDHVNRDCRRCMHSVCIVQAVSLPHSLSQSEYH